MLIKQQQLKVLIQQTSQKQYVCPEEKAHQENKDSQNHLKISTKIIRPLNQQVNPVEEDRDKNRMSPGVFVPLNIGPSHISTWKDRNSKG